MIRTTLLMFKCNTMQGTNKHRKPKMIVLMILVGLIAVSNTKPYAPMENALSVLEANLYIDTLMANIRTDEQMSKFDPLVLPFHRHDELSGFHIMTNGTATGLSTLHRQSDRNSDCLITTRSDGTILIRATVVTNNIGVVANLLAQKNNGEKVIGKLFGTMQKLNISIEIKINQNGDASLNDFVIMSVIYLEPETFVGESNVELSEIIHNAMYYSFSTNYGFDIGRIVNGKFRDFIANVVSKMNYPIQWYK